MELKKFFFNSLMFRKIFRLKFIIGNLYKDICVYKIFNVVFCKINEIFYFILNYFFIIENYFLYYI